jgi:hypothetical protein
MGIAGIEAGIGIDARDFLLASLRKRKELQSEAENLLVGPQRQLHFAPTLCLFAANGWQGRSVHLG